MADNFYEDRFQENVPLANLILLGLGAVRLPINAGSIFWVPAFAGMRAGGLKVGWREEHKK